MYTCLYLTHTFAIRRVIIVTIISPIGLQALALKAQYEAAVGNDKKQSQLVDQLKSLAATGEPGASAKLTTAQVCLAAGDLATAYQLVNATGPFSPEQASCKIQILLKLDRLDLAKHELQQLQKVAEESVLAELCGVYIHLATGSSMAGEAEHSINSLSEQYGPSVYLLNLLAVALALQGDYAAAETKLNECLRDYTEIQPQHETLVNLVAVLQQQNKTAEAAPVIQQLVTAPQLSPCSLQFAANLERVNTAFDREAAKYKV